MQSISELDIRPIDTENRAGRKISNNAVVDNK